jgi:uncharacterized protein YbaA (DUF1428 family)
MKYVEAFLMPVPIKNLPTYRKMARKGAKIWKEHGCLDYKESVAADTKAFPGSVKAKRGELIVLSWIVYKSKRHCESVTAAVMKDKRLGSMLDPKAFPFDPKRMIRGYFQVLAGE